MPSVGQGMRWPPEQKTRWYSSTERRDGSSTASSQGYHHYIGSLRRDEGFMWRKRRIIKYKDLAEQCQNQMIFKTQQIVARCGVMFTLSSRIHHITIQSIWHKCGGGGGGGDAEKWR